MQLARAITPSENGRPEPKGRILVVDDEPEICSFVCHYLVWLGYEVETTWSVSGALQLLECSTYDLVVTDLRIGASSGLDLMTAIRARTPATRMILMSAHADAQAAAAAIDRGVDHLLLKPFDPAELGSRVELCFERRSTAEREERERSSLRDQLHKHEQQSSSWIRRAVHALTSAVEAKDKYTAGHASRVSAYAMALAEEVGGIDLDRFRLACDLHDIGKIGVPDSVLNRPARLSDAEYELVIAHPDTGERILQQLIDDEMVLGTVRWHHERWDGKGYPDRLVGEAIPLPARVLAIADTLDAMTSSRAYRGALPWAVAVKEIRRCAGTQFDPLVVEAFDRIAAKLEEIHREFTDENSGSRG